ncbi:MAG: BON domain-containing protein [Geminicoccaceae bacterium]
MHQSRHRSLVHAAVFGGLLGLAAGPAIAQTAPDNTKVNKRDRAEGAVTADQAKENPADRELAKKIRAAITDDDALSTYAQNVKVIVRDGKVTLKGPVRSAAEKTSVAAKATEIAGPGHVVNSLSIAHDTDKDHSTDAVKDKDKVKDKTKVHETEKPKTR